MRGRGVVPGTSAVARPCAQREPSPGNRAPTATAAVVASQREFAVSSPQKLQEEALGARDELRGLCPLWDTAAKSELASVSRSAPGGREGVKGSGKGEDDSMVRELRLQ